MRAPTLVIGYGNPSRGDDGLGPAAVAELERRIASHPEWGAVELLTDYQLQIEFVTDLAGRERVLFIDADASGTEPCSICPLEPQRDCSVSTHASSPANLLSVYRSFHGHDAPPSFLLGIRGYQFALGMPLSSGAQDNLAAAMLLIERWLAPGKSLPSQANGLTADKKLSP